MEGSEVVAMGLVPSFAAYPSSTTVESERVGVSVVVRGEMTRLSDDEDVVEDVGSELDGSKRWVGVCQQGHTPVGGIVEGVGDGKSVSSVDETG